MKQHFRNKELAVGPISYLDRRVLMDGRATPSARPKKVRTAKRLAVE